MSLENERKRRVGSQEDDDLVQQTDEERGEEGTEDLQVRWRRDIIAFVVLVGVRPSIQDPDISTKIVQGAIRSGL
jgi:predicted Ser/Thr protein kinase